jgi:MFS family permease
VTSAEKPKSVLEGVTVYHWLVVIIASCGWLFDCMDQRFFTLAKESALKELLGSNAAAQLALKRYLGIATAAMMIGWGTGGIIFGVMSDKVGRVKTMIATLLVYSGFTGLSGFAQSWIDFTIYRFLVGLGVGGMFGSATTLVAESVPGQFRTMALGSLQALSATGNIIGSLITLQIPPGSENVAGYSGWRSLFLVGILPAILVVPIIFVLKEPEVWKKAKLQAAQAGDQKQVGSFFDLFTDVRWRRRTLVGLFLGLSGMVGLWGIGFFSPELITAALKVNPLEKTDLKNVAQLCRKLSETNNPISGFFHAQLPSSTQDLLRNNPSGAASTESMQLALSVDLNKLIHGASLYNSNTFQSLSLKKATLDLLNQVQKRPVAADVAFLNRQILEQSFPECIEPLQGTMDRVRGRALALQDVGSFIGMMAFTFVAAFFNRRKAFCGTFILCFLVTMYVFSSLKTATDAYWMLPLMGFCQLALFAGYSIYFPELYPTRLRGTGVGFCYNTVRYLAAPFPILLGELDKVYGFRTAAIIMSSIYLVGLIALLWAPETKDQPLPEG